MAKVRAPMPEINLPTLIERKLLLIPTTNVPMTIRIKEAKPTFLMPRRSEIIPLGIAMNMPGKANRLMRRPA